MRLNLIAIKNIEKAIMNGEMVGIAADRKIVSYDDSRAELFVKTYKTDCVSDVFQRITKHVNKSYPKKERNEVHHHHHVPYVIGEHTVAGIDNYVCSTGKLVGISNRYS